MNVLAVITPLQLTSYVPYTTR